MRRTGRGAGTPVRPPTVWVKRTQPSPLVGLGARSGRPIASNVRATGPSFTVVLPISPPPLLPEVGDAPFLVDLHPPFQDIREAEAVGVAQRL